MSNCQSPSLLRVITNYLLRNSLHVLRNDPLISFTLSRPVHRIANGACRKNRHHTSQNPVFNGQHLFQIVLAAALAVAVTAAPQGELPSGYLPPPTSPPDTYLPPTTPRGDYLPPPENQYLPPPPPPSGYLPPPAGEGDSISIDAELVSNEVSGWCVVNTGGGGGMTCGLTSSQGLLTRKVRRHDK